MSSQTDSHLLNFSRVEVVPRETEVNGVSTIADKQRCISEMRNGEWSLLEQNLGALIISVIDSKNSRNNFFAK